MVILHSFLYVYQRVCRVSCLELDMIHMIAGMRWSQPSWSNKKNTTQRNSNGCPLVAEAIICEPWCWGIYLHNWVILFGQMLVNIPAPWSMGMETLHLWLQTGFPSTRFEETSWQREADGWTGRSAVLEDQPRIVNWCYPLVSKQVAIENGHRNSWFTH